jgi:hypothetical protein
MVSIVSVQLAWVLVVGMIGFAVVVHSLVIAGVLPLNLVWGGRMTNRKELVRAEIGAMASLAIAALVAILQARGVATGNPALVWVIGSWVMAAVFVLNTLGNLASRSMFEKVLFTPLTLALALLFVRLALG